MHKEDLVHKFRKIGPSLKDILENNRFYFSSPADFNDPFDASIVPSIDIPDDQMRLWFEETRSKLSFTPEQKAEAERILKSGEYTSDKFKRSVIAGITEGLKEHGICSFSKTIENILLWSHYAENHTGVAIGLQVQQLFSDKHYIVEVHYSSEYPQIKLHDTKKYQELLKRKYLCWEYEKEVRVIHKTGAKKYLDVPINSIQQIVFGMNCPDSQIDMVLGWIDKTKMNPRIEKAVPMKGKYELQFHEIRDWKSK